MNFFYQNRGAISIFLVIVLLPMMTISAIFVDVSKVRLGEALAESAGELALNTALTDYDTKLKDLYGLMATAQNMDDLFGKLEGYFKDCIMSYGLSEYDADYYTVDAMKTLGLVAESGKTADIMNMDVLDFKAEKLDGANLANAALLEKQIVEFMKYRGPLNTGLSFLSSLKSFTTLSKQTKMVEKRQEYYEEQKTLMENLKSAWSHIVAYNQSPIAKTVASTEKTYLEKLAEDMAGFKNEYLGSSDNTALGDPAGIAERVLRTAVIYDKLGLSGKTMEFWADSSKENSVDPKTGEKTGEKITVWDIGYNVSGTVDSSLSYLDASYSGTSYGLKNLPTADDVGTAVEALLNAQKNDQFPPVVPSGSDVYPIQYFANESNLTQIVSYCRWVLTVHRLEQKYFSAMMWLDAYDHLESPKKDADGTVITKDSILNTPYTIGNVTRTLSEWIRDIESMDEIYSNFKEKMGQYAYLLNQAKQDYDDDILTDYGDMGTILLRPTEIQESSAEYRETLRTAITHLQKAILFLTAAKGMLGPGGSLTAAKEGWSGAVNDGAVRDTSMAKQDKAEIDQLNQYLNETNVDKLITRLQNVYDELKTVKEQLEGYEYADVPFYKINSGDGYMIEEITEQKWNDLSSRTDNRAALFNDSRQRAAASVKGELIGTDWAVGEKSPDLSQSKPALYSYLANQFKSVAAASDSGAQPAQTEDEKNGNDVYKSIKNTAKDNANKEEVSGQASKDTVGKTISGDDLPSGSGSSDGAPSSEANTDIDNGAVKDAGSGVGGMFSDGLLDAIVSLGESLRDGLYVSDYIMSMFSYDTIEKENEVENEGKTGNDRQEIRTLTKNPIDAEHNDFYGVEVEYIVYGDREVKNDLVKAYGSIYGIRLAFNLIYAFATSEIRDSAFAIATPISAATLGILPVPLVQAIIIIALALCESGMDLTALKAGEKLPLFKSKETWHCSPTGIVNYAKGVIKEYAEIAVDAVIDAGVNELNKVLDMTADEIEGFIDSGAEDLAKTVGDAYDQVITQNAEMAIQQLTSLVSSGVQELQLELKTKDEIVAGITEKIRAWGAQQTGSDIASKAKKMAADYIAKDNGKIVDNVFVAMKNAIDGASEGGAAALDEILNGTAGDVFEEKITSAGGEVMDYIEDIRNYIENQIINAGGVFHDTVENAKESAKDALADGADSLKENLHEQFGNLIGGDGDSPDAATGIASLLSFSYSDYLRLFLLISYFANEKNVMLRTGDIIQLNMIKNGSSGFKLNQSASYVRVTAELQVKPTLLALPLFADVSENAVENTNWYTFTYSQIAGY